MPKDLKPELAVSLRIILVDPPTGVDYGIQEGKGNNYKTIAVQRSKTGKDGGPSCATVKPINGWKIVKKA